MTEKAYRVGSDVYGINYERTASGDYEIRCTQHPHNPYDDSVLKTHLYSDGRVCVSPGKEPETLDRAKGVAYAWMMGYSHYVRTGEFPSGSVRVNV